jgi:hypothetical protein
MPGIRPILLRWRSRMAAQHEFYVERAAEARTIAAAATLDNVRDRGLDRKRAGPRWPLAVGFSDLKPRLT